jgi:hypothetical protein
MGMLEQAPCHIDSASFELSGQRPLSLSSLGAIIQSQRIVWAAGGMPPEGKVGEKDTELHCFWGKTDIFVPSCSPIRDPRMVSAN